MAVTGFELPALLPRRHLIRTSIKRSGADHRPWSGTTKKLPLQQHARRRQPYKRLCGSYLILRQWWELPRPVGHGLHELPASVVRITVSASPQAHA